MKQKPEYVRGAERLAEKLGVEVGPEDVENFDTAVWWRNERDLVLPMARAVVHWRRTPKHGKLPFIAGKGFARLAQRWSIWLETSPDPSGAFPMNGTSGWMSRTPENLDWFPQGEKPSVLNRMVLDLKEEMESGEWQVRRFEHVRRARVILLLSAKRVIMSGKKAAKGVRQMAHYYQEEAVLLSEDIGLRSDGSET